MAYKKFDEFGQAQSGHTESQTLTFTADGQEVLQLPHAAFVTDSTLSRDGLDLTLTTQDDQITIENYFAHDEPPVLNSPSGESLSPALVNSFVTSSAQYAQAETLSDVSPIGLVDEITGDVTVTRLDGSSDTLSHGMPIYQGDVVETASDGAVNIVFADESSFAVSEDTRMAMDEFVFDPASEAGVQNFSVLKGLFVYTSGIIGREDPDDVQIDTPIGSIGIRGTIIAGNVDTGDITVVEGAIVLTDLQGNQQTLANQFETAQFKAGGGIENKGQLAADDVAQEFSGVAPVAPNLFSSISEGSADGGAGTQETQQDQSSDEGAADQDAAAQGEDAQDAQNSEGEGEQGASDAQDSGSRAKDAKGDAEKADKQAQNSAEDQDADQVSDQSTASDDGPDLGELAEQVRTSRNGQGSDQQNGQDQGRGLRALANSLGESEVSDVLGLNARDGAREELTNPDVFDGLDDDGDGNVAVSATVAEGATGGNIAGMPGVFSTGTTAIANLDLLGATLTNASLSGPANNFFGLEDNGDGTLNVVLLDGAELDAENQPFTEFDVVIDTAGGEVVQTVELEVENSNITEGIQQTGMLPLGDAGTVTASPFFSVIEGGTFQFDFNEIFTDLNGQGLNVTIDPARIADLGALGVDVAFISDGLLSVDASAGAVSAGNVELNVTVGNDAGDTPISQLIQFGVFDAVDTVDAGSGSVNTIFGNQINLLGNGNILTNNGSIETFFLNGSTSLNRILGNDSAERFDLFGSDMNIINSGGGEDFFNVIGAENMLFAGAGNDIFSITGGNNKLLGQSGNDAFNFQGAAFGAFVDLNSSALIDGGTGDDVINFGSVVGDIGFGNGAGQIDVNQISNIEVINVTNGTTANTVTLTLDDVIAITDGRNELKILGNAGDGVDFTNTSSSDFFLEEENRSGPGGQEFDVYSDGIVTLLVDTDVAVTGLPVA